MINNLLDLKLIQYDYLPSDSCNIYSFYSGASVSMNLLNEFDLNEFITSKLHSLPEKSNDINSENYTHINSESYIYMFPKNQIIFLVGIFKNKTGCIFNSHDVFKIKLSET